LKAATVPADHCVVITTIQAPTPAVRAYAGMPGWQLVVAGDRKTREPWACGTARYLSLREQQASDLRLGRQLPENHYCRKNLAYLEAIRAGARVIVDTDDDNIPLPGWSIPPFEGSYETIPADRGFVNIYKWFTDQHIWPRGLPLDRILSPPRRESHAAAPARVGVWQGLANADPDVDAIYRLVIDKPCDFDERPPLVLGSGTCTPFNSQNTAFLRELFPLLYLPALVTFRFTDILRGLIAQPIMWLYGWRLGFTAATVVQERNPHDYLDDFRQEVPCYLQGGAVIDAVRAVVSASRPIEANLLAAYEALARAGIVPPAELPLVQAWLEDLGTARGRPA